MFRFRILLISSLLIILFSLHNLNARTGDIFLTPRIGVNNLYTDLSKLHDIGGKIGLSTGYFAADRVELELELSYNFFTAFKYLVTTIENPEGISAENNVSDIGFSIGGNYYLDDYTVSFTPYLGLHAGYTLVFETVDAQYFDKNFISSKITLSH
jgi:hypothetical protein